MTTSTIGQPLVGLDAARKMRVAGDLLAGPRVEHRQPSTTSLGGQR
jgi:hypothetical protein